MPDTEEAINEHMRALREHDLAAFVDGYAEDAMFILGAEPVVGREAIHAMFAPMMDSMPTDTNLDLMVVRGEYAYITYEQNGVRGSDTFHVRDGKIVMQSAHIVYG
jgi:uncharacterized protein (TIGR02246 family)